MRDPVEATNLLLCPNNTRWAKIQNLPGYIYDIYDLTDFVQAKSTSDFCTRVKIVVKCTDGLNLSLMCLYVDIQVQKA